MENLSRNLASVSSAGVPPTNADAASAGKSRTAQMLAPITKDASPPTRIQGSTLIVGERTQQRHREKVKTFMKWWFGPDNDNDELEQYLCDMLADECAIAASTTAKIADHTDVRIMVPEDLLAILRLAREDAATPVGSTIKRPMPPDVALRKAYSRTIVYLIDEVLNGTR